MPKCQICTSTQNNNNNDDDDDDSRNNNNNNNNNNRRSSVNMGFTLNISHDSKSTVCKVVIFSV